MKVSIITVTYNSGQTIADTIKSVLGQSYPDIEYIIVDGNSTDNTVDIIKEYQTKFLGRLRWISEKDKGLYDAMNKGIRMAEGDIIGILNSDDFFSNSDIIRNVVDGMENYDAVYGDVHYVDCNDITNTVRYYSSALFKPWKMRLGFMPAHPSYYCRREVFEKFGCFDLQFKVAADFEMMLRHIFIHNISTKYLPLDFVTMRIGGLSTSGFSSHRRILKDHMLAYSKNKVHSNYFLEGLRYIYKLWEICSFRIRKDITRKPLLCNIKGAEHLDVKTL